MGSGLGTVEARHISDGIFLAAARAIADLSPAKRDPAANLPAPLVDLRKVSFHIAVAAAKKAQADGLAEPPSDELTAAAVRGKIWSRFTRRIDVCAGSHCARRSRGVGRSRCG